MKSFLTFFLFIFIGFQSLAQETKKDELLSLKDEAKGLLYSEPSKSYELFLELEKKNNEFYKQGSIDKPTYEGFRGSVNSGLGNYYLIAVGDLDSAFYYYDLSIIHYRAAKDIIGIGSIFNNKGVILEQLRYQDSALMFYDSAIFYYTKGNDPKKCSKTLGNIGNIYIDKGNYPLAQTYYLKSHEYAVKSKDTIEIAYTYFGLGNLAEYSKNNKDAEMYYQKSLDAFKTTDDLFGLSTAIFSIANVYKNQLMIDSAYFMYQRTLKEFRKSGYMSSVPQCHINISVIFNEYYDSVFNYQGKFDSSNASYIIDIIRNSGLDSAIYHGKKAVSISKAVNKPFNLVYGYISLGTSENLRKNYNKALMYADSAYEYIKMGKFVDEMKMLGLLRYKAYKNVGKYQQALEWYEVHVNLRDSLFSLDKAEELITQKYQFEYEMKSAQDSVKQAEELKVKNAEIEVEKAENAQRKTQIIYLAIIAVVLLALGIVIFQRLKITQRQKQIIDDQKKEVEVQKHKIELQHHELEETHKEISDSIRYAKRLQGAILPELEELKTQLKDGFVIFQPKDVVSGDFYWMQPVDGGVLFAAADCTGHGVPGAMVSVVCSNALNRSVKEFGLIEPSDILNKTRDLVIETFASSTADVKDGMDIALCKVIYTDEGATVSFSGANNPLWILRNNGDEIEEIKGAKQPIGKYENHQPFTQHEVMLSKQDSLYIFSDGYADQFGGEKGKKMKLKPFKDFLVSIKDLPMDTKKEELIKAFESWKGSFEQVDDVTVIGVKII